MKTKGLGTGAVTLILALIILGGLGGYYYFIASPSTGPGGITVPEGFEETSSKTVVKDNKEYEITTYTGTVNQAMESFRLAFKDAGWNPKATWENFPIPQFIGGSGYEKKGEGDVIAFYVETSGDQVKVYVTIGPDPRETGGNEESEEKESPEEPQAPDEPQEPEGPGEPGEPPEETQPPG